MQNLKYKALSIAMAVMTAASPVLSSYTAYASDNVADNIVVNDDGTVSQTFNLEDNNDDSSEEKETKFLFLNLKTTGGKAIISEGKDQEQTIRLDEKQDGSEYIDVYDQNGLLISSENAAENAYMYVYEAEADNIVSVKAEADDGYVINLYELVDDDTSKPEETGFDEKVTSFMYPTFVDADKTITIGFEKTETPEDDITVEEVKTEDKKDTQEDLADDLTVNDEKSEDGETDGEEDKTENDLSGDLTVNDTVEDVDKTADAEGTGTETEGTEAGSETAEDDADADDKMGDLTVNDDIGIDGSSSEEKAVVDGEEGDGTTESIEEETDSSATTSNEDENEDELLNDSDISTELVTGDKIDEEKELAADEAKSDTEGDIADEEGYPSCASYIYKTEAVAKKDKYFDINTYSEYENTNIEVVSVDGNTDQQTWNDDDSFTVVYKESLKDNPDYYWNKEVKFVVVEDADMATAKSSECDNILPDWAPIGDADGVGVPELAGTVLQGKTYNVLVNDTSWNPDVVTNGYDISRFRMSTTGDLGDFDVSKPGSYTLRYVVSYFTLPKYRWYVDTTINVVDNLDGHRIKVLNYSIDVRMNGERLEYGELYASEQSNVTFTVQVSNINTFNEINPVVKVLNGAGEENPEAVNFTTVDSDSGKIYTYNVSLKDDEYITIDDTNNICTFALGQSYFGAWYPIKDNYITKDDINEIEQTYGNVNTPPEDEGDIVAYASGTNTKNFGAIGVGQAHGANVGIGAVGYRTVMLGITSSGQAAIAKWVSGLTNSYDAANMKNFKAWLNTNQLICADCTTWGEGQHVGWYASNQFPFTITAKATYNSSTNKLTVRLDAVGNASMSGNYQELTGYESFTGTSGYSITIRKRLVNEEWAAKFYRVRLNTKFTIYRYTNNAWKEQKTVTLSGATRDSVSVEGLQKGKYKVVEETNSNGCVLNHDKYIFYLNESNPSWQTGDDVESDSVTENVSGTYVLNYTQYYYGIILKKENNEGIPLSGAYFKIEYKPNSTSSPEATWYAKTDTNGEIILDNKHIHTTYKLPNGKTVKSSEAPLNAADDPVLPPGCLTITEVEAPDGYQLNSKPVTVSLKAVDNETRTLLYNVPTFINTPGTGDFQLNKKIYNPSNFASKTPRLYINTQFKIYSDYDTATKTCSGLVKTVAVSANNTDDTSYSVMVEGLKPGRYYLQESKRNPGTVQNTNTYYFDIIAGKTINKFTNVETGNSGTAVANNPFRLTGKMFSKTDPNGRPLSGATFKVVYSPLEPEDGYNPMYTWYFETDSNGEVLYDSNHYVSNFNGSWSDDPLKLDDGTWAIPSGSLWVTEVKAPAGYKIDTQTHSIKLTGRLDSNGVYTIPDLEAEDLTIIEYPDGWNVDLMTKKMDVADGTPLSNAVFGIYSDRNCNNLIARLKSDIDGYTGTYRMEFDGGVNSTTVYCREIEAPEGYQRNDTIYPLTLTKANDDGQTRIFGENGINGLGVYDEKVSEKWKLRYRVKKVDGDGNPVEGVVFRVYDESGDMVDELTTNANGYSDITLIKDIESSVDSYVLYCKEYRAPAGYIFDSTKRYTLTWNRSTYDALKNRGDESGELQTFGGDRGIVNLTPTASPTPVITQPVTPTPSNTPTPTPTSTPTPTPTNTPTPTPVITQSVTPPPSNTPTPTPTSTPTPTPTNTPTPTPTSTPTPTPTNTPTPTPTNTPTPTSTPIPTPTDEPPTPGTGYVYVKKTSRAGQDLMDLDGYSLKGGKFSVTGGGFTGTLTTEENGISNHLQLPNNAYQTAVANDYEDTDRAVVDETTIAPLDDTIAADETSDDMEDVDTTSDSLSDDVVNANNAISEDVDALLDADYSDSSDEVIDNIDEYTGDDEGIANMALNPKITSYKVTEIEAPLGHNNYGVTKSFSVTMPQDKDRVIEVQFSDDPKVLDSRMTIKKLSAKGNPISGTIFKVEYIDDFNGNSDNVKRTWYLQSDANGIVRFDDNHVVTSLTQYRSDEFFKFNNNIVLPYYGQLRFTEVSTPASYVLNSEPFVVNLADAQNGSTVDLSKTVYNDLEPAKVQLTKYKDDGSPLAGVEFELKFVKESETATNNKSESFSRLLNVGETTTATTDADGKITWENLDQGDYEIRETKTVDGCALLTDVIKITLPLQLTKDEADSYGNVNKDLAKEDTNYTKKWYFFDCKYEIKNNQVFLMPMTGSDGTWMYGFVGFAAIAFTGCLYLLLDEKKKNKRKHRRKRR